MIRNLEVGDRELAKSQNRVHDSIVPAYYGSKNFFAFTNKTVEHVRRSLAPEGTMDSDIARSCPDCLRHATAGRISTVVMFLADMYCLARIKPISGMSFTEQAVRNQQGKIGLQHRVQ